MRFVEHRLRAGRLATDRLTCATKALVSATGVLPLATIALMVVKLTQLSDGHCGTKRSTQPTTSWTLDKQNHGYCLSLVPSEKALRPKPLDAALFAKVTDHFRVLRCRSVRRQYADSTQQTQSLNHLVNPW